MRRELDVRSLDATERKTLVGVFFLAGCLLLAPKQWAAAGMLIVPSIVMFVWHVRRSKHERRTRDALPPKSSPDVSTDRG